MRGTCSVCNVNSAEPIGDVLVCESCELRSLRAYYASTEEPLRRFSAYVEEMMTVDRFTMQLSSNKAGREFLKRYSTQEVSLIVEGANAMCRILDKWLVKHNLKRPLPEPGKQN